MKYTITLLKLSLIFILFTAFKAENRADKTSVTITESDHFYELKAKYDPEKTEKVQKYMDKSLPGNGNFSFQHAQLDATLTLDSKITFYIKANPGELVLKFDKRKNNADHYAKFKKMCEGLKGIIGEN